MTADEDPNPTVVEPAAPPTSASGLPELPPTPVPHTHFYGEHHHIPTISDWRKTKKEHAEAADEYAAQIDELNKQNEALPSSEPSAEIDHKLDPRASTKGGTAAPIEDVAPPNATTTAGSKSTAQKANDAPKSKGQQEKEELMDRMKPPGKPIDRVSKKGERRVRDPITGEEVVIKDADPKDFDNTFPRIYGSNVNLHPFPPAQSPHLAPIIQRIEFLSIAIGGGLFLIWSFSAMGHGWWRFLRVSMIIGGIGAALVTMVTLASKALEQEMETVRLDMHRQRGETFVPPYPEGAEWLNSLIKLMWGLVNPSMFVGIADMVEDIMQASLPSFVDAVRISDLGQGSNPLRILSIRALQDQPGDTGYPKRHWIDQGTDTKSKNEAGKELEEDDAGDYYNFELAFSYAAQPGQGDRLRSKNIHLLLEFFLGAFDWFHLPVKIWVVVEQIGGIVRLRCQFIPEYPYVRNVTFSLQGVPTVEISAIPLSRHLPNVLNLPLISSFVKSSIAAGLAEMCAPKSMTINMQEMLSSVVGDTRAVGVFVVTVHYATDLSAQDANGFSDPYVVLAYAKFGKPLYSSRIITEELNPIFEETCVLLLTEDEIRSKEELSCILFDSDAHSADDLIGRIQLPVAELMNEPNQMKRRTDKFKGFEDADEMPGTLTWSIGYFEKAPLLKELERGPTAEEKAKEPAPARPLAAQEMSPYDKAPKPAEIPIPPPPDLTKTRPDPKYPSGVLSIILHQVTNLERQDLSGATGDREGEAGQDTDDASQVSSNLPSGYGEFIVNDDMIYKTRVKQYTTNPYYEAGTECFVRDFNDTVVRVVIRDSRLREADPILGVVSVKLSEVFAEASSVSQSYAITEGVGFGKAVISFAFRGMQVTLPPNLRGWNTGTLDVSDVQVTLDASHKDKFSPKGTKLTIKTSDSTAVAPKKDCEVKADGTTLEWQMDDVRLPVYARYQSSVVFELGGTNPVVSLLPGKGGPDAIAVLWLQDLTDDIEQSVKIPIITGPRLSTLRQNAINDITAEHHEMEVIGSLSVTLKLDSGLDPDHELLSEGSSQARRHAYQAYYQIEGAAEVAEKNSHANDDGVIDKDEKKAIAKAHRKALESRGRGLAQLKPYRMGLWMKDGVKTRLTPKSTKSREPAVQTEA